MISTKDPVDAVREPREFEFALALPEIENVQFESNYIRTAVCELRFPVVLDLESKPPLSMQKSLRKNYTEFEVQRHFEIGSGNRPALGAHRYLMKSPRGEWTIAIKSDSLSLETNKYSNFEEFSTRLQAVTNAAKRTIDTDVLTRLGLRYVNLIPLSPNDPLDEWVNPVIVAEMKTNVFGAIRHTLTEIHGGTSTGKYTVKHGIQPQPDQIGSGLLSYLLDFDFYVNDVPVDRMQSFLRIAHDHNFRLFVWALGERARRGLGAQSKKSGTVAE